MKKNRAFLKWAGGKYPLLDDIKRHLPKGECLVEPFVGAGSVFLNTDFSRYILADINSDLISLYNIVKMRTDEYVQAARELFVPETNCAEVYYQFREAQRKRHSVVQQKPGSVPSGGTVFIFEPLRLQRPVSLQSAR
ncbi:hypothetical protein EIMP300_16610 [Escherichia coli]|uniref:DNA adenine methylase n=1 Tax=Escherichia coli TaxID=562 RepID=A0A8S0FGH6_ECOLX|nr:hypothetical protein EIMP300_16610 [Escherichia coli]